MESRSSFITRAPIREGPYDLAVIGGGINGAAIARDAAWRGKSVILLEKDDFGAGTSSRSSKMVHGGIRYLEHLRFGLVHESLRERHLLLRLAPHLVTPQSFVLPFYAGARRGPRAMRAGLFLYDLLALGKRIGKSRSLERSELLARVPEILPDGLLGGGIYHDAVMDDARLVLLNACGAGDGAPGEMTARNYVEVTGVRPGSPSTVVIKDRVAGEGLAVLAHHVVRALGPWTDPRQLVRSKGIHLVLRELPMRDGLLLTHARDGRVFFVIPWLGRTVVGTTETPFDGPLDGLRAEPEEVRYLLDELRRVFPGLGLGPRDILATFAGVRPLARGRRIFGTASPGRVSRAHRIVEDPDGVLSVFGGKYTTYRAVAREVVDRLFPGSECRTRQVPLPGGEGGPWSEFRSPASAEIARHGEAEAERLFRRYGTRLRDVLRLAAVDPSLAERLSPEHPELRAEVAYALENEHCVYPEDFLARRTALRFTAGGGRSAYGAVETMIRERLRPVPPDLERARERYFAAVAWEDQLRAGTA